jgi:hypothetical protein
MAKLLGWLTITGLALIALGLTAGPWMEVPYPIPLILLCLGGFCSLIAGIPWAHTPGKRGLKIVFLGVVGFAGGGAAGLFLGEALGDAAAPSGDKGLGTVILAVIVGFWVGAILFGSLGVWWGISFHRRSGPDGTGEGSGVDSR